MRTHTDRILAQIQSDLELLMTRMLYNPVDLHEIKGRTLQILHANLDSQGLVGKEHISITCVQNPKNSGSVNVVPTNLFSFLLMSGIYVSPDELVGKSEVETSYGTFGYVDKELDEDGLGYSYVKHKPGYAHDSFWYNPDKLFGDGK